MFADRAQLLRIYLAERDRHEGLPLYEWMLQKACDSGIAGATVIRGIGGFCSHSPVHSAAMISPSVNLPVIIEIVEQADAIEAFVKEVEDAIPEGLMTLQDVETKFFDKRHRQHPPPHPAN